MGEKHVIQVPVNAELYSEIIAFAEKSGVSRAEVMRGAFIRMHERTREAELDRQYREGYQRIPDDSRVGQAQVTVLGQVLNKENCSYFHISAHNRESRMSQNRVSENSAHRWRRHPHQADHSL